MSGAVKSKLSNRSSTPPCPGKRLLESLTPYREGDKVQVEWTEDDYDNDHLPTGTIKYQEGVEITTIYLETDNKVYINCKRFGSATFWANHVSSYEDNFKILGYDT